MNSLQNFFLMECTHKLNLKLIKKFFVSINFLQFFILMNNCANLRNELTFICIEWYIFMSKPKFVAFIFAIFKIQKIICIAITSII